jgi:phospholipid/cholesterol/gamma-HCH transport system substrate-binding protein
MENKSHALAAGAFVIFVTALVVALATWLSRDNTMRTTYEMTTRDSVSGLSPQAAVRYRGIAVGKVQNIEFDPKVAGNVLITLAINDNAPITESTFASLAFQGVTGLAFVQLDDTGGSSIALKSKDENPARIPLRPGFISKLTDKGDAILTQLEETTKRFNALLSADNQKTLFGTVQSAGKSAEQVGAMSVRIQSIMDAQFGPERTNIPLLTAETTQAMKAIQGTAGDTSKLAAELGKVAAESGKAVAAITSAADAAANAAKGVTNLTGQIVAKGGVLDQAAQSGAAITSAAQTLNASTLPRINRVADDASRTARGLGQVANTITDNPQSLLYGNGAVPPGPGESGFSAPANSPAAKP